MLPADTSPASVFLQSTAKGPAGACVAGTNKKLTLHKLNITNYLLSTVKSLNSCFPTRFSTSVEKNNFLHVVLGYRPWSSC